VGINNELPQAIPGLTANIRILNFDMTEVANESRTVDLPADGFLKDVIHVALPDKLSPVHFIKLRLTDAMGKLVSDNFYWRSNQEYKPGRTLTGPLFKGMASISRLPKAEITSTVTSVNPPVDPDKQSSEGNMYDVTVSNPSKALAFMVWIRLQDASTGKPIRPAFYTDNFISLLPGESQTVRVTYPSRVASASTRVVVDGWNVSRRQYDNGKVTELPDIRHIAPPTPPSLALGKPTTASSFAKDRTPEMATDPDDTSRWSSDRKDDEWIMIDLGKPTAFSKAALEWESAYATEYKLQTSDDGSNWRDLLHKTDGKGGHEELTFPTVTARYFRLYGIKRATGYGISLFDIGLYP
jgi:hypothetical protein